MTLHTVYLICAVAGGTVLVLRLILMFVGLDHGIHADTPFHTDIPHDAVSDMDPNNMDHPGDVQGPSVNLMSIQSLSGFFTMFGLVGMGLLDVNAHWAWSLLGAIGAGLLTAWAATMIVVVLHKLQSEGKEVLENAVGQVGTIYLTVPEQGSGVITVTLQGAQRQYDAISESGERIPTGSIVRVTGVKAGKLMVMVDQTHVEKSTVLGG
jgi:hypothetical protein